MLPVCVRVCSSVRFALHTHVRAYARACVCVRACTRGRGKEKCVADTQGLQGPLVQEPRITGPKISSSTHYIEEEEVLRG